MFLNAHSAAFRPVALAGACMALLLALAACSSDDTAPTGSAFSQALYQDYTDLASQVDAAPPPPAPEESFFDSLFDWFGSDNPNDDLAQAFRDKASAAQSGAEPAPEPAPADPAAQTLRGRLVRAVDAGKDQFPEQAARAQADYDCWVMDGNLPNMADAAQACRTALNTSLPALENAERPAAPPPPPVASAPAPAPAPAPAAASGFTVYFGFDSWTLTAEDLTVITNVINTARTGGQAHIAIVGHTDTSGPADYNQRLSVHRANVVEEAMVDMGARRAAITVSGVGETDLAVQTPDGVREAKNRRAVATRSPDGESDRAGGMAYDYVIVGAGSAGSVLADRLSADPAVSVLIEAGGPDRSPNIHMPAGVPALLGRPNPHNWYYRTEPQAQLGGRRLYWPRGRGWGGSSSINGMIHIRGQAADYDRWRDAGCEGWSYADVLPYFRRSECWEGGSDAYHGGAGPLRISHGRQLDPVTGNPLFAAFIQAGVQAGYPHNPDFNGAGQEGFGPYQLTIAAGRRCSAARAYLRPALRRRNLTVISHAHVARIVFDGRRARHVDFMRGGKRCQVSAEREILLSAGAVNTPQILLLSGLGTPEALRPLGIGVVAALKDVGRNLQDHLDASVQVECTQPITLFAQQGLTALKTGLRYLVSHTGPAASQGLECGGFVKSDGALASPDLQFHFINGLMTDHTRVRPDRHGFMTHVCHLRPESRGFIGLGSADPLAPPLIQPRYLSCEGDRRALREGVRIARQLFAQAAFDAFRGGEIMPGAAITSDAAIDDFLNRTAETIYHPVGTARMGSDDAAVVDLQLKVRGVEGLRVVDASVMPSLVSGNTNAPTIMIAEKAADLILGRAPCGGQRSA